MKRRKDFSLCVWADTLLNAKQRQSIRSAGGGGGAARINIVECLARTEHFVYIISFDFQSNAERQVLSSLYRWENWVSDRRGNFFKAT